MIKEAVMERLNLNAADYLLSDDQLLSESDLLYFRSIVKRLQLNEPFQHIIGYTSFFGLKIKTDKRALIPRPETEELVEWILNTFEGDQNVRLLDLCTGTGCIALALKSNRNSWDIDACDLSEHALALAKENSIQHDLKLSFLKMDVLDPKEYSDFCYGQYDCWVANPPYIPEKERAEMNENVTGFDPGMALFVPDKDPLLFYRSIAEQGRKYIKKGGYLFFEIHENFGSETKEMLESLGYTNIEIRKDLQGKDRMIWAVL
jgi:release factor glutamine methyltransferase